MSAQEMEYAENTILETLNSVSAPMSSLTLIDALAPKGVRDDHVRLAMWRLIDLHRIRLTNDWELESKTRQPA